MRRYETIFILNPDLSTEDRDSLFNRVKELIPNMGGIAIDFDEWGIKSLAYEIKKAVKGYYIRAEYCGDGKLVDELERLCRINDPFLKYMTVLLERNVDAERIKEEIEEAKRSAEQEEQKKADLEAEEAKEGDEDPDGLNENDGDSVESDSIESESGNEEKIHGQS